MSEAVPDIPDPAAKEVSQQTYDVRIVLPTREQNPKRFHSQVQISSRLRFIAHANGRSATVTVFPYDQRIAEQAVLESFSESKNSEPYAGAGEVSLRDGRISDVEWEQSRCDDFSRLRMEFEIRSAVNRLMKDER